MYIDPIDPIFLNGWRVNELLVHHHLVVRANITKDRSVDEINEWLKSLIECIGMNILHGPVTIYCDKVGNAGTTSFAVIDTSHLALHTWIEEIPNMLQLDVYSCAKFNIDDVLQKLSFFEPSHVDYKFLNRTTEYIEVE